MSGCLVRISENLLAGLHNAGQLGPHKSERWDNYFIFPEFGKFPARLKVEKTELNSDQVFLLASTFRKRKTDPGGDGYAINHTEFRLYPREPEAEEKIYILNFAHCGKDEDISFSSPPVRAWRLEGEQGKGVIFLYDPEYPLKVRVDEISSEVLDRFPVQVAVVGVEPVSIAEHSIMFPKYEAVGADCLYDRRRERTGHGLLEVVKNTKGKRSWIYFNLKDGEAYHKSASLVAHDGKLAVQRDGRIVMEWN